MTLQYGLRPTPHLRKYYFPILRRIKKGGAKRFYNRVQSRGTGKTAGVSFIILYFAEYIAPFMKGVQPENRNVLIIGRTETYVKTVNMSNLNQMICQYAPWLKSKEESEWGDAGALAVSRKNGWGRLEFNLTNGVSIFAFGLGQSVRGHHVYLAAIDDAIFEDNYNQTESQLDYIEKGVKYAVEPGGAILNQGTPQSTSDLFHSLKAEDGWDVAWLPGWDDARECGYKEWNEGEVASGALDASVFTCEEDWHCLFPDRFNYEAIMADRGKSRSSIRKWLCEVQLRPLSDDTMLVHPNDVAAAKDPGLTYLRSVEQGQCYAGLDPSMLKEDPAGIVVVLKLPTGKRQVVHLEELGKMERGASDEARQRHLFERIRSIHERYRPKWLCESNGMQAMIKPLAEKEIPGIKMDLYHLGTNKHAKDGWPMIRTVFEAGDIILPTGPLQAETDIPPGDWDSAKKTKLITEQLKGLQFINGKVEEDRGVKNDVVSALFLALRASEDAPKSTRLSVTVMQGEEREKPRPRGAEFGTPKNKTPWGQDTYLKRWRTMNHRGSPYQHKRSN